MKKKKRSNKWLTVVLCAIAAGAAGAWLAWRYVNNTYAGQEPVRFYVPAGTSPQALSDTLSARLGQGFGSRVYTLWKAQKADPAKAYGSYVVNPGDKAITVSRNLRFNRQTPLRIAVGNARTLDQLYRRIGSRMAFSAQNLRHSADSVLRSIGFTDSTQFAAAFLPYTYELYWTDSPAKLMSQVAGSYKRFWTDERRAKARKLGLTPTGVATLASIVEEETAKADERPRVARLYLNRLNKGIKLQADPTVKFAIGDFAIRRISGRMLKTPSPYNTYIVGGLPPGPIRLVETATIDGVLDAPQHPYIYMCAKEDFSGYHNFATDYKSHIANARRYQAELNKRNIR